MTPTMSRRLFLERCGLGALAAGLCPIGIPEAGAAWGDIPPAPTGSGLSDIWPANYSGARILEIYCYGGLSMWETFWVNETAAQSNVMNWRGFAPQNLAWNQACAGIPNPAGQFTEFAQDSQQQRIFWGPA
ncbi:MAG: hypothetical protein WCE79_15885, partial [Xanthobacteraceae bacterium]